MSVSADAKLKAYPVAGEAGRYPFMHPNDDMEQPRMFWNKVLNQTGKDHLVFNVCNSLGQCRPDIQQRMLSLFNQVDKSLGDAISKGLNMP